MASNSATHKASVSYTHSRLCFKAAVIEPLALAQTFRITTSVGTFAMTKRQFYTVFSNVVLTRSYREGGLYHYPKPPAKADQFRVG